MSTRTDVKYNDRKEVKVSTSWIGHQVGHVRQGYWITFRHPDDVHIQTGRVISFVTYTGPEHPTDSKIKDWIVAVVFMPTMDGVGERWIDPAWVLSSTPFPPTRVLEFMCSDFSSREAVMRFLVAGIPTGFGHYYTGPLPVPDPRWTPVRLREPNEVYNFEENVLPRITGKVSAQVQSRIVKEGIEIQSTMLLNGVAQTVSRKLIELEGEAAIAALVKLGWTPPPPKAQGTPE